MPKVEADFEQLFVSNTTHLSEVGQALEGLLAKHGNLLVCFDRIGKILNEIKVVF